jgi:hypothetical protein
MSERMSVTVSEDNKTIRVAAGNALGIHREITIHAEDAGSIVSGLIEVANVGDQMVQAQLAQLAQRVEALEKLTKGDKAAGATS